MGCELCGRSVCARWMHSFSDQDDFDNKTGKYAHDSEQEDDATSQEGQHGSR